MKLQVFKKINASSEWDLICTRTENINIKTEHGKYLYKIKSFNNNYIVILTSFGILIYTFNENNKSISLNYFYLNHTKSNRIKKKKKNTKSVHNRN